MALRGLCVIELAGLAPVPFCGMMLSDFGARVIRIDKPGGGIVHDCLDQGKESVTVNLKHKEGINVIRKLCHKADVLIEPFRPGVMEKLGLGPKVLMDDNPKLIYARLTGYGQSGGISHKAGHDINYIAMSGVLSKFGRRGDKPFPPINVMGDFAGGGLMCAFGILGALIARNAVGKGQIVDANMVEGSAYLASWLDAMKPFIMPNERGHNLLDGGSAFYGTYQTKDGKYMAVGAIEPQFYTALLKGLGLENNGLSQSDNQDEQEKLFTEIFRSKTREEWTEIFKNLDACVTPVLDVDEAAEHDHNKEKGTFKLNDFGVYQANPAPRLSLTPAHIGTRPRPNLGQHNESALLDFGFSKEKIAELTSLGVFGHIAKL